MDELLEVALAHENVLAAFSALPPHLPGGLVDVVDGFLMAFTKSITRMFNQVLPIGIGAGPNGLANAVEQARATGVCWVLQLRDGIDDHLLLTVEQLGLVEDKESQPAMIRTGPLSGDAHLPRDFEIRRAIDAAGFDDHVAAGTPTMRTWLGEGLLSDPDVALFTGYVDGAPVAKSMSVSSGSCVGIYNVSTDPSCRRKGYGWAMTATAMRHGITAGCSAATLQASPMGLSVYAAHGFRTLFRYRLFGEPPALPAEASV